MRNSWVGLCVGLAASLTLAACEGQLPQFGKSVGAAGGKATSKAVGRSEVTVTRNKVRILGTDGFCVDPVSTRSAAAQAFVVFGNCAAITRNPDQPQPYLRAIATATVTSSGITGEGAIRPQVANLNAFFRTDPGKVALSRSNTAETVTVIDGFTEDGALYLRVKDLSPAHFEGAQDSYWRAYFDAGNSSVALSVIGFSETPVTASEGLDVLRGFVERNQRPPAAIASVTDNKPDGGDLLDRLFP